MGLSKSKQDATFVKVVKGLGLVVRVKEGTEGSIERRLKNGETVRELIFDELSGYIREIKTRDVEFNGQKMKFWSITLTDHGETYILSLPFSSRYSSSFLKRLPNVMLSTPITIHCAYFADDDKQVLWLSQEGVKVEQAYTKDEPNGLPEMEQIKVKGELVWDDTKMMEHLTNMVEKDIQPKLAELNKVESVEAPLDEVEESQPESKEEEMDDLPF